MTIRWYFWLFFLLFDQRTHSIKVERAINVNIEIMRAFVRLRLLLSENAALSRRLDDLEKKYDTEFKLVFDVLRELAAPKPVVRPPGRIGFS